MGMNDQSKMALHKALLSHGEGFFDVELQMIDGELVKTKAYMGVTLDNFDIINAYGSDELKLVSYGVAKVLR